MWFSLEMEHLRLSQLYSEAFSKMKLTVSYVGQNLESLILNVYFSHITDILLSEDNFQKTKSRMTWQNMFKNLRILVLISFS